MYNALVCRDIHNKAIIVFCYMYCGIMSIINILDSTIIIKLINHEQILFDYEDVISIIECCFNIIAIIYFIIYGTKIDNIL